MSRKPLLPFLMVAFAAVGAAGDPATVPKPGFNLFSKQQDIQLGQEAAQQVRQQYQVVQNQFLQDYIRRVGERLASTPQARQSGFPFTFTLLNANEVNAFALPGGPAFVFTGLFKDVDSEGELAGVLAHELSHVILRHGTNQVSKANLLQIPAMLAGAVVGNGTMMGQLAQLGIGLGFNSMLLKFSRNDEAQADELGARLMAEAGYNPMEMARFFEKLSAEPGQQRIQFLSDHPNTGNRVKDVQAVIRTLPRQTYTDGTGDFARAKQMIAQLPPAPNKPQQRGSLAAPETPASGAMRQARGQYFSVSYPDNWQAFGEDTGAMTIAPQRGLVRDQNGGTAVGYGAILSYFSPENGRANLRNATSDLIQRLRAENPSLKADLKSQRRTRVSGSDGLITTMTSTSPYGGEERDELLTIMRPEGLFYMVFVAPSKSFQQLQPTFEAMRTSLRFSS